LLRELAESVAVRANPLEVTGIHLTPGTRLDMEKTWAAELVSAGATQALPKVLPARLQAIGGTGEPFSQTRLGRFDLLEKLGQGGMGAVYRAKDPADGRIVAIKVLRPEWNTHADALRRFHKEARLLAEVNNPFVTNLLEVNEDAGVHYLVLEFVAGHSL